MSVIEKNLNVQNGSVLKTFQLLDCFTLESPIQRIGDLCDRTGMNRSTIFRFMNSLSEIGIVEKRTDGAFKLGIKLFELGIKVDVSSSLANKAQPYLKALANSVQESAHMVVRDKVDILYILKEESTNSIRIDSAIGIKRAMYCTGVGKAILAFMDEDYMNVYFEYQSLEKRTNHTLTSKNTLNSNLESIRESFISIDNEEFADHVYCVATPVFDSNSQPVGAISVSGLKDRMIDKKDFLNEKVLEAGKLITGQIGGEYPMLINNDKKGG